MKDNQSFEDNIKKKMEEFDKIPSNKIWEELSTIKLPNTATPKTLLTMKNILFPLAGMAILACGFFFYNQSESTPIQEEKIESISGIERLEQIKKQAQEQGKKILVKITMEGCTMCGKFEKETFSTDEVQESIKDDFIIFDLDIFDPSYKDFFKQHEIKATPITLFLNEDGYELAKVIGARDKAFFLEALEIALEKDIELANLKENDLHEYMELNHSHHHPVGKKKVFVVSDTIGGGYYIKEKDLKKMDKSSHSFLVKESDFNLKVFPNPNDGNFKITLEGSDEETILNFMNGQGQRLVGEKIEGANYARTLEYNFGDDVGVILLRAEQGKKVATEKIIIQK